MDWHDDELMQAWFEFVMAYGSNDAASVAMDLDSSWLDLDPDEMTDLLNMFADENSYAEALRVSQLLLTDADAA